MKRLMITMVLLTQCAVAQRVSDSTWREDVKTVTLTREGVVLEAPVLTFNSNGETEEGMLLQFDILADEGDNLRYSISHCDRHWQRDSLEPYEFMTGFEHGDIENIEFSFTTLRPFVHYSQRIPTRGSAFRHSGNFVLTVTSTDSGDTLFTKRFWVEEADAMVEGEVTRPYDGADIMRRQEVDVVIGSANNSFLRQEYTHVLVQQNGRLDNQRWLEFSGYDGSKWAYRYRQSNIFEGGNTYRFFDCSNLNTPMYNVLRVEEYGGERFAILKPEEDRSKKHYLSEKTLFGGMKVNVWDRQNKALEADYVWVNITLPMAQPMLDRSVYVVGQMTDWKLDEGSRMDYKPEYKAYVKRLLLKQGYYSYLLLCQGRQQVESATERLEGNHMETPNTYIVYVYYRDPSDRADRLVAVKRIKN